MKFIEIIAGIAVAVSITSVRAGSQEPPDRRQANTLSVTGTGESMAAPDIAYVTVGVVTTGSKAQDAAQANSAATTKVTAALKRLGIADKDIQTSDYAVMPQYDQQPRREGPRIIGYQVSNNVRATIRKLDNIGKAIDAALDAGANNVHGVAFGLDKREQAESEALSNAVKTARRKADTLAAAAGVRITGVQQVQEGVIYRPMPMMESAMFRAGGARDVPTPISPGELTITANVTVVYSIANSRAGTMGDETRVSELRNLLRDRESALAEIARLKSRFSGMHPTVRARVAALNSVEQRIEALSRQLRQQTKEQKPE